MRDSGPGLLKFGSPEVISVKQGREFPVRSPMEIQERESSDSPMLNAFCRVAPSVLFNFLAILVAGVFRFAIDLSPRTSVAVQARRLPDFLAIEITPSLRDEWKAFSLPLWQKEGLS